MNLGRRIAIAGSIAAAMSTAGCDRGTDRLSHDAFVERGDELCAAYNDASGRLISVVADEDSGGDDRLTTSAPVLAEMAATLLAHAGALDGLVPPAAEEAGFAAMRDRLRIGAQELDEAATLAAVDDLTGTQRSFERYAQAVDAAAAWAAAEGFRACARRVAVEETEEAEIEGPPMEPDELAAYCAELAGFAEGLGAVSASATPAALEDALLDLTLQAASLADLPPPGTGSALGEARAALDVVRRDLAEHDFDLDRAEHANPGLLAELQIVRGRLEVRVLGLGACAGM